MSTGWYDERPAPLEIISTQAARKIRSKFGLPSDVSDGIHGLDRTMVRCTATSRSCSVTRSFAVFSVTFARAGSRYSISDREQRHAKCGRLSIVAVSDV